MPLCQGTWQGSKQWAVVCGQWALWAVAAAAPPALQRISPPPAGSAHEPPAPQPLPASRRRRRARAGRRRWSRRRRRRDADAAPAQRKVRSRQGAVGNICRAVSSGTPPVFLASANRHQWAGVTPTSGGEGARGSVLRRTRRLRAATTSELGLSSAAAAPCRAHTPPLHRDRRHAWSACSSGAHGIGYSAESALRVRCPAGNTDRQS